MEDASVANFLSITEIQEGFNLPLSLQAKDEAHDLQQLSAVTALDATRHDVWMYNWGLEYSSSRFYKHYFRNMIADEAFSWIWKSNCTMKIKVFTWLLLADRVNTRNMLARRHYNIDGDMSCRICTIGEEETVEHLFFACPFSKRCWGRLGLI